MRFRVTFEIGAGDLGARETYYSQDYALGVATGDAGARQALQDLVTRRNNLLFDTQRLNTVRVVLQTAGRIGTVMRAGSTYRWPNPNHSITIPATGKHVTVPVTFRPESLQFSARVKLGYGWQGGLQRRETTRYLSTVPDGVLAHDVGERVRRNVHTIWWDDFKAFADTLSQTPWHILGKRFTGDSEPIDVKGVVASAAAPNIVGIQMATGDAPAGWTKGTVLNLQGFRHRGCPCPTLNGMFTVERRETTTDFILFFLRGTESIDPTEVKTMGSAQLSAFDYAPILDYDIVDLSAKSRGNVGGRRRGKSSTRCCPA